MENTMNDPMPQEVAIDVKLKQLDGTWKVIHTAALDRRFGDGNAFSSGSVGYNAGGPVYVPDIRGAKVLHSFTCTLAEQGSKGLFSARPERVRADKDGPSPKELAARARYGR